MKKQTLKTKNSFFSHDKFFKDFYSDPKLSQELLQLIFSKKECTAYNLKKLKIEKDTFEDKRADLVLSLPFKDFPKIRLRVFILLEHKSSYDKNFYDQLLDYQVLLRKLMIQQNGYVQPIIPVLFYHGKGPFKWKRSLQEEDFKVFFNKIPRESRKNMLNYEPKIINTKDPEIRKASKKLKGYSVIKLLDEIWRLKKRTNFSKVIETYLGFKEVLKPLKGEARKTAVLSIWEYLLDNTDLDVKIWGLV
ncbi:MAG: Rpn family recombination-promoting nuclease/putative transposase, partial [Bdellovibrionales bacterium]|nr:Rpn family recombination-promoting nuclease/putative transposase [Bdellovibrionales bacterium]